MQDVKMIATRRTLVSFMCSVVVAMTAPMVAIGHGFKIGDLDIDHPWTRVTPPGAKTAAFYFVISNKGDQPDRLIAIEGTVADQLQIHTHMMDGGIARMRQVPAVDIPAKGTVAFAPGGFHVMAIGLKGGLDEMDRVPLTLVFEKAGRVKVEAAVEPLAKPTETHKH
jgi:copper(I)-binding protein